ncbi:MAG: phospholipid scramblase-related protein [Zavarzinella sp.]
MLNRSSYFIREHVGMFKLKGVYDILDPESNEVLASAKETSSQWVLWCQFLINQQFLPIQYTIIEAETNRTLLILERGVTFFRSVITIKGPTGEKLGYLKNKLFAFKAGFYVYDSHDNLIAQVKGDWVGWNFRFIDANDTEIGIVTKKWAGIGKELFTSADNYLIKIHDDGEGVSEAKSLLLLAAGLAIDTVYKSR